MTVYDGHRLPGALEDLAERSLKLEVMLGNSHYGATDNAALAEKNGVDPVAPTAKGHSSGRLTLEDLLPDEDGLVLRCRAGIEPVSTSLATAKLQARFDLSRCQDGPDVERCPMQAAKHEGALARFQYTPARAEPQKRGL